MSNFTPYGFILHFSLLPIFTTKNNRIIFMFYNLILKFTHIAIYEFLCFLEHKGFFIAKVIVHSLHTNLRQVPSANAKIAEKKVPFNPCDMASSCLR